MGYQIAKLGSVVADSGPKIFLAGRMNPGLIKAIISNARHKAYFLGL